MNAPSLATHFKLWRLRRLLCRIRKVERAAAHESQEIDTLVERQDGKDEKQRLAEFKDLVIDDEADRLKTLKEQAVEVYQRLEQEPFGKELLSTNGIDSTQLRFTDQRYQPVQSAEKHVTAPLFRPFQLSWRIVQAGVSVTLLCFAVSLVWSLSSFPPNRVVTMLGVFCLGLTVIAAVAHSAISLAASLAQRKNQSVLAMLTTWLFEIGFIGLCSFFAYQLYQVIARL